MIADIAIPPRDEWKNLSSQQLFDLKSKMQEKYLMMADIGASFTSQYLMFLNEIDVLIKIAETAKD
jgi:uncharacterized protein affecting Mg2+/Co2+ transport